MVLSNLQEKLENTFSHLFSRSSIASAKDFLPDNQGAKASEDKKALDWRISNWRSIVSVSRIFSFKATICSSKGTTMALSNSASSEAWFEDLWSYNSDHFQLICSFGSNHRIWSRMSELIFFAQNQNCSFRSHKKRFNKGSL